MTEWFGNSKLRKAAFVTVISIVGMGWLGREVWRDKTLQDIRIDVALIKKGQENNLMEHGQMDMERADIEERVTNNEFKIQKLDLTTKKQ